jgi:hypothetical protein
MCCDCTMSCSRRIFDSKARHLHAGSMHDSAHLDCPEGRPSAAQGPHHSLDADAQRAEAMQDGGREAHLQHRSQGHVEG